MAQQVRQRQQNPIAFQASSTVSQPLSRGMIYRELYLKLTGTIDATGNIATTDIEPGDEWGVVKRIQIIANGSDVLWNSTGEQLGWFNYFLLNARRKPGIAIAAGHPKAFNSTLVLPFWMPKAIRPIDTALDSRLLSDLRLQIDWGTIADVCDAAGASFTVNPLMSVWSLESFGISGPFSQKRIFRQQYNNVAASTQFIANLPVGAMYRGFMFSAKDANGDDVNDLVTNIKVRSGTTVFVDIAADTLRDATRLYEGREYLIDTTGAKLPLVFTSSSTNENGWNFLDLTSDYLLSEAIDTLGFSELVIELATSATIATLEIIPLQIIPVRQAKPAPGK